MRKLLEVPLLLLVLCVPAAAAQVTVTDAWFRALPGALPAAGYFTLRNAGSAEISVTGAQAKGCGDMKLHQSTSMGGMSGMEIAARVAVPAGGSVAFAPGGYHLMCEGGKLKPGTKLPVALRFSDGTAQVAAFAVRGATGK